MAPNQFCTIAFSALTFSTCFFASCRTRNDADPTLKGGGAAGVRQETSTAAATSLELNDISILVPLPSKVSANKITGLLTLEAEGRHGRLLSDALFDEVYRSNADMENSEKSTTDILGNWHAVTFRFDPCEDLAVNGAKCTSEAKIVAQPITAPGGTPFAHDAAIHLVYHLDRQQSLDLVKRLAAWKHDAGINTSGRLRVNPILQLEVDAPAKAHAAFEKLVLDFCGVKNLALLATMSSGSSDVWTFNGFQKSGDTFVKLKQPAMRIETTASSIQSPRQTKGNPYDPTEFAPEVDISPLFNSIEFTSPDKIQQAWAASHAIENPRMHNLFSVPCAVCHTTSNARREAQIRTLTPIGIEVSDANRFVSKLPVDLAMPDANQFDNWNVHNFGHFNGHPFVSPRVIHETARALEILAAAKLP